MRVHPRLYIGATPASGDSHSIYTTGDICVNNSNVSPSTTNTGSLGLGGESSKRWGKLYLGTADTYGDVHTPVYWNDGVPTITNVVVKYEFTIAKNNSSKQITLADTTYKNDMRVIALVVNDGLSYLTAPLTWEASNGILVISASDDVKKPVSGYVLMAKG